MTSVVSTHTNKIIELYGLKDGAINMNYSLMRSFVVFSLKVCHCLTVCVIEIVCIFLPYLLHPLLLSQPRQPLGRNFDLFRKSNLFCSKIPTGNLLQNRSEFRPNSDPFCSRNLSEFPVANYPDPSKNKKNILHYSNAIAYYVYL